MRKRYLLPLVLASITLTASAQSSGWPPPANLTTIPLWPHGAPGAPPAHPAPEADTTTPKDNLIAGKPLVRLGNVSVPTLTVYPPKATNTGAAIVVFPGGGYNILAIDLEGTEVCDWLNSAGIHLSAGEIPRPQHRPLPKIRCGVTRRTARDGDSTPTRRRVAHRS